MADTDVDVVPVRLPSGTKAVVHLPRTFTLADGVHLMNFLTEYVEECVEGGRRATPPSPSTAPTKCTCPSGLGSLAWPCPEHPPSTAPDDLLDMLGRVHPYAMPMEDFERAEQRLQRAVDLQQPLPVPDQAAIVWRGDLMRLIGELQHKRSVFEDWKKMRAALGSRPAEVDDEGLPPLPEPKYCADDLTDIFTAEQYRQGQRDAVAADRARRGASGK